MDHHRDYLRSRAQHLIDEQLRSHIEPSDAVQQTLVLAQTHREQFRGEDDRQFRAWLERILRRVISEARRRLWRWPRPLLSANGVRQGEDQPDEHSTPSRRMQRDQTAEMVQQGLNRLPADQRTAVILRCFEECSLVEIARRMGRTEPSVAGLIRRGLEKLRQIVPEDL